MPPFMLSKSRSALENKPRGCDVSGEAREPPSPTPNSPCKPWPHKCCPNSGGRWLPVSCLPQTIRLRHRQPVPTGESGTSVLPGAWDSPIPTSTAPLQTGSGLLYLAQPKSGGERKEENYTEAASATLSLRQQASTRALASHSCSKTS